MKPTKPINWKDLFVIFGAGILFLSCIATTHHTARTLDPGQGSVSAGYLRGRNLEETSDEPVQLVGLNTRFGLARSIDCGLEHTWDISKDNENIFATIWGDCKIQLSNKDNVLNKPIFSTGLLKGYVYKDDAQIHISSLPLMLSLPVSERFTPTFMYRYELISEGFFPESESFENPRHAFAIGFEYDLKKPDPMKWSPKIALGIGTLNSLAGGSEDPNIFIINFGLKINSPYTPMNSKNE